MKKFNPEQYRDELAAGLKEINNKETDTNNTRRGRKDVLSEAQQTPEYIFSNEKNKHRRYKEKLSVIVDQYFAEEGKLILPKSNASKFSEGDGTANSLRELEAEKKKDVLILSTEHVDLKLDRRAPAENIADRYYIRNPELDRANKYVLLDIIQPNENDPRIALGKRFLEQFPEYKSFIDSIIDTEDNSFDRVVDEKGKDDSLVTALNKVVTDKEKVKTFFAQQIAAMNLTAIPEPVKESYVVGRPEDTHIQHRIVAQAFANEQLVPEAGVFGGVSGRGNNILAKITSICKSVQRRSGTVDDSAAEQLMGFCVILARRDKRWNQNNAPLVIVDGGGFMTILEDGTIAIYDISKDFGKESDRTKTMAILENELPDRKFVVQNVS